MKQKSRKLLAVCIVLVLCLTACGSSAENGAAQPGTQDSEVTASPEAQSGAAQRGTQESEVTASPEAQSGAAQRGTQESEAAVSPEAESGVSADETESSGQEEGSADTAGRRMFDTFKTVDLEGNEVTEAVLSQADITFVNIWGTFCPPCIAEMPELEEISQSMPENMQMIGILCDVYDTDSAEYRAALEIVEKTGVTYPSLIRSSSLNDLVNGVYAVPTSFFVDSEGRMLGDPLIGADTEAYKERIRALSAE